jgi:hypothetical protein
MRKRFSLIAAVGGLAALDVLAQQKKWAGKRLPMEAEFESARGGCRERPVLGAMSFGLTESG